MPRPPTPPFTKTDAQTKVQSAEDAWNTRDPATVASAYTIDSQWRNRDQFFTGRSQIQEFFTRTWQRELDYALRTELWSFDPARLAVRVQYARRDRSQIHEFLTRKWQRELDYALRKELWSFDKDRSAVRFQYESRDIQGQWWRSYGNELWEFDEHGLMRRREASINDVPITPQERRIFGTRPTQEHGKTFPMA